MFLINMVILLAGTMVNLGWDGFSTVLFLAGTIVIFAGTVGPYWYGCDPQTVYCFWKDDLCDVFIELSKGVLSHAESADAAVLQDTRDTLWLCLDYGLRCDPCDGSPGRAIYSVQALSNMLSRLFHIIVQAVSNMLSRPCNIHCPCCVKYVVGAVSYMLFRLCQILCPGCVIATMEACFGTV
jgi:hypothetical protein